ncbi:MAG: 50S ribosomal protein L21 [Bacteroidota bacterium]|nr:50S ribosomal protein L21 [Bacteroidota bacterium]
MYAIVEIAGQQFKVENDQQIYVHRLENKEGEEIIFNKVLLIENNGLVSIGTPVLENTAVTAEVLTHLKGDKVVVFKKKRRKGYKVRNGHRQFFTKIKIKNIDTKVSRSKEDAKPKKDNVSTKKATTKKVATKKVATKKATTKKATTKKATTKKATTKKATTKKATTKKTTAKKKDIE